MQDKQLKTKISLSEKEKKCQKIKKMSFNYDENMQRLGIKGRIMTQDTIFIVLLMLKTTLLLIKKS